MVDDAMGTMDDDMDDMEDTDLDRIIDSVKNPEKNKNNRFKIMMLTIWKPSLRLFLEQTFYFFICT